MINASGRCCPTIELGDDLCGIEFPSELPSEKYLILRETLRQVCVVVDLSDSSSGRRLIPYLTQLYNVISNYITEFLAQNMCGTVALLIARKGQCEVASSFTTSIHTLLKALKVAFAQRTEASTQNQAKTGNNTFSLLNVIQTAGNMLNMIEKRFSEDGKETTQQFYRHFSQEVVVFISNPLSIDPDPRFQDKVFEIIRKNAMMESNDTISREKHLELLEKQIGESLGSGFRDSLEHENGLTRLTLIGLHEAPCVHLQLVASSPEYQLAVCHRLFDCNYIRVGTEPSISVIRALAFPKTVTRRVLDRKSPPKSGMAKTEPEKVEGIIALEHNEHKEFESKDKRDDIEICALPVCFPSIFTPTSSGLCMCHLSPFGYGNESQQKSSLALCSIHGMMRKCFLCGSTVCRDGMFCPTCGIMLLDGVGLSAAQEHMRPQAEFIRCHDVNPEGECYGCFLSIGEEPYVCKKCGTILCRNCYESCVRLNMCPVCDL